MNQTRDQLPWPWETKYSSTTGVPYYYNRSNGESTWQHPMQDRGFSTPRQYPRTTHTNESHRQPITSTDAHRSHSDHRNWQERAHNHATPPQPRHSATAIQPSHRSPRDPVVGGPGSVRHGSSHQLRGPEDRFSESPPRRPYTARSGDPAASGGPAGTDGLLWASPRDRGGRPPVAVGPSTIFALRLSGGSAEGRGWIGWLRGWGWGDSEAETASDAAGPTSFRLPSHGRTE